MSQLGRPFTFGERIGVVFMVQSAGLSALTVLALLFQVMVRFIKRRRKASTTIRRQSVIGEPAPASDATDSSLFLNLMVAELIQAIGGLLNIKWAMDAGVTEGPLCTAQGALKQIGDVGVALTSLGIAVHTFSVLALRWHMPRCIARYIIAGIWLFIFLAVTIAPLVYNRDGRLYYGDTNYWCWIKEEFLAQRLALEYLWMWLAAFLMLVLYGILALVMRGVFTIRKEEEYSDVEDVRSVHLESPMTEEERQQSKAIANLMLFYPAVYIFCVFPVGLVRWLDFSSHYIPPAATITASFIFSLSGLLNVLLYRFTRPDLVTGGDLGQNSPYDGSHALRRMSTLGNPTDADMRSLRSSDLVPSGRRTTSHVDFRKAISSANTSTQDVSDMKSTGIYSQYSPSHSPYFPSPHSLTTDYTQRPATGSTSYTYR